MTSSRGVPAIDLDGPGDEDWIKSVTRRRDEVMRLALSAHQSNDVLPGVPGRPDRVEVPMDHGDSRQPISKEVHFLVPIEKGDTPQRVTYGVVLEPDSEDLQGDVMTAEDIEKAAYDWMERSQHGGHMHADLVDGAKVVESYIAPCDIPVETAAGTETIRKGSWVLAMRWPEHIWESIQKGELTGYSVGGTGVRLEIEKHRPGGHDHDQSTHGRKDQRGWRLAAAAQRMSTSPEGKYVTLAGEGPDSGESVLVVEDRDDEYLVRFDDGRKKWVKPNEVLRDPVYPKFTRGQKVKDAYGNIHTVASQNGPQVFFQDRDGWAHPTKIWPVKKSAEEEAVEAGLRDAVAKHGNHDQSEHGNWARGGHQGNPARDGAAAEGGGTPADRGAASARHEGEWEPDYGTPIRFGDGQPVPGVGKAIPVVAGGKSMDKLQQDIARRFGLESLPRLVKAGQATSGKSVGSRSGMTTRGSYTEELREATRTDTWQTERGPLQITMRGYLQRSPGTDGTYRSTFWATKLGAGTSVKKHGNHDQSSHGNWARDRMTPAEQGNAAGRRDMARYHSDEAGEVAIPESDHSSGRPEDEERDEELRRARRGHTTRDGVKVEDQPKVQRIKGSEMFASGDGRVQLNYGEWKWLATGQPRGEAKPPKLHERGNWGVWPRGADRSDTSKVIWAKNQTLAEFINSLDPGEYDLAT